MFTFQTIRVPRVKNFAPCEELLAYAYSDCGASIGLPADLWIYTDWQKRGQKWSVSSHYLIHEFEIVSNLSERGFFLLRSLAAINSDPSGLASPPRYNVLINENPRLSGCDCRGGYSSQGRGQHCKHVYAMQHLLGVPGFPAYGEITE